MNKPLTLELGVKTDPIQYRYTYDWLFRLLAEEGVFHVQLGSFFEMYQLPDDFFTDLRQQANDYGISLTSIFTAHRELGGWFRNEITGPEDFQGLKFRMPGMGGQALGKLGASVQNLPGSEVYQALASGAIDGTEWIGPWADEKAGFQEITKIYYTAGFHEPAAGLTLATNREVYESLSPGHQKIIEVAAGEANAWNLTQFLANNGADLQRLESGGVTVREFPDSVWDAFGTAAQETLDEYMGDELFAKIRESAYTSMASSSGWIDRSINAFARQRDLVLGLGPYRLENVGGLQGAPAMA